MTDRPILFSAPMVRALLAGTKTQTRRLCKRQPDEDGLARIVRPEPLPFWHDSSAREYHCPYGLPGDRLWVRETWRTFERPGDNVGGVLYFADGAFVELPNTREASDIWVDDHRNGKHGDHWRPSIYMRRWASRITLEVTEVRVQRLQDISEEDARAEGVSAADGPDDSLGDVLPRAPTARDAFEHIWDEINGKRAPWASNPWLWCVSFKRTLTP